MSTFFIFLSVLSFTCLGETAEGLLSLDKILSLSCEFSYTVSRSKRSAELSDNPKEVFQYLFPLANLQPEEYIVSNGRSNSIPTLTSYFDDIIDLWHEECAERRKDHLPKSLKRRRHRRKRSSVRIQGVTTSPPPLAREAITWGGYLGNLSSSLYTYMPSLPALQPGDEDSDVEVVEEALDENVDDMEDVDEMEDGDEEVDRMNVEKEVEIIEEDADDDDPPDDPPSAKMSAKKKKKKQKTTTPATTTTTAGPTLVPPIADQDPNFASYGGDIEYFFPILSTTIPFDGEITLLGFHGFKGMFPY